MKKQLGEITTTLLEKILYVNCPRCGVSQAISVPRESKGGVTDCSICDALFEWEIKEGE